jgi:hypothetical protein
VGGDADVTGDASVGGNAAVTGNASVGGDADVTGDASVGGNAAVTGNATVGGNAAVTGTLGVTGATTTNGITNTGNVGTTTLSTTGNATVGGNAAVAGNASVGGDAEIDGDTVMNGTLTVGGTISTLPDVNMNVVSSTRTASFLNNNNQGVVVGPTSTRISGGTGSTSLILNDSGATFGNATNGGGPARVTGVADGTQRYDAVNYGQLERAYEGVASAAALAALPQPVHGKNYSLGVGYGHFAGENAVAVGARGNYQNFSGTVGGAFSGSEEMVNVGVGYSW